MTDRVAGVDVPSFVAAAILTPIFLFLVFSVPFYISDEHSGATIREISSIVTMGVVFGFPFYVLIGLPIAWLVIRSRASLKNALLILAALAAALAANALSLLLFWASCFPSSPEILCDLLPIFAIFGFPHAVLFAITFVLSYIGFRALRR